MTSKRKKCGVCVRQYDGDETTMNRRKEMIRVCMCTKQWETRPADRKTRRSRFSISKRWKDESRPLFKGGDPEYEILTQVIRRQCRCMWQEKAKSLVKDYEFELFFCPIFPFLLPSLLFGVGLQCPVSSVHVCPMSSSASCSSCSVIWHQSSVIYRQSSVTRSRKHRYKIHPSSSVCRGDDVCKQCQFSCHPTFTQLRPIADTTMGWLRRLPAPITAQQQTSLMPSASQTLTPETQKKDFSKKV